MKTNFESLKTAFDLTTTTLEGCHTYEDVLKVLTEKGIVFDANIDMTDKNPWKHCVTITRTDNPELEELAPDDEDWDYLPLYTDNFDENVTFTLKYYPDYPYKPMVINVWAQGGWKYQKTVKLDPDYYGLSAEMIIAKLWGTDDIRVTDIFIVHI